MQVRTTSNQRQGSSTLRRGGGFQLPFLPSAQNSGGAVIVAAAAAAAAAVVVALFLLRLLPSPSVLVAAVPFSHPRCGTVASAVSRRPSFDETDAVDTIRRSFPSTTYSEKWSCVLAHLVITFGTPPSLLPKGIFLLLALPRQSFDYTALFCSCLVLFSLRFHLLALPPPPPSLLCECSLAENSTGKADIHYSVWILVALLLTGTLMGGL
ncbi:hypothetical protein FN846DRAFT_630979 [Sphaerosporella brunnea]|uniref:Uncharacterized protein n=1 Tax=Sphaerosporella brunnea TaxID=1250544 RepID=A0A5J5F0F6_9PEZI|nr:hypothetical protein FN846DRAFT_630979 [Sphaerosporella brunnea]